MNDNLEKYFIDSSRVRRIKYYPVGKIMEVQFVGGRLYHYFEVPESVFESAMQASSIGKFIESDIKGKYGYKQITE